MVPKPARWPGSPRSLLKIQRPRPSAAAYGSPLPLLGAGGHSFAAQTPSVSEGQAIVAVRLARIN